MSLEDAGVTQAVSHTPDEVVYLERLAADGDTSAQSRLGEIYYLGDPMQHVEPDHNLAFDYFSQAAEATNPSAHALNNLATLYVNGIGTKKNTSLALKYFEAAAEQGYSAAYNGLGFLYLHGTDGLTKNETKAFEYFTKAAEEGHVEAFNNLGIMHFNGIGTKKNLTAAYESMKISGIQGGMTTSLYMMALLTQNGWGVKRSCEKALPLFKKVAERGDFLNKLPFNAELAFMDFKKGNFGHSLRQYAVLSEIGISMAELNVAFLLEQNKGLFEAYSTNDLKNLETGEYNTWRLNLALTMYNRSSIQGQPEASRKLGDCMYGNTEWENACQKNVSKAIEYYERGAKEYDGQSSFNLGYIYQFGLESNGAKPNFTKAFHYYNRSRLSDKGEFPGLISMAFLRVYESFHYYLSYFS